MTDSRPDAPIAPPDGGPALTPRAFWGLFAAAWIAYGGLTVLTTIMQGGRLPRALVGTGVYLTPLVLPAAVLAIARKRFLSPSPSVTRSVARKTGVGLVYALTASALGGLLTWVTRSRPMSELGEEPYVAFLGWFLSALFLYTVFLIFLMWSDAVERAHESRSMAAREAALRAQAEAKAIRAQFNPHFVFNTLHSLMLLVRSAPEVAERAIEDVAALIRYASTLERQEIDQVTLAKELAFAERYVALEKLRLADRLEVAWDVDPTLNDALVPAFALQTLLENAIKHGIAPEPGGGLVRIGAAATDGLMELSVSDDGAGTDPGLVAANEGRGIHLLRSRLEAVHEGSAEIAWATAPGAGFHVRVRLPLRRAGRESAP